MSFMLMNVSACAQQETGKTKIQALVAYFSATGTTRAAAEELAGLIGADLWEIRPEIPYSEADLDWHDRQSRSSVEMNDASSRPAIVSENSDMARYSVVFIGFPVWWNQAPRVVNTFLESHDLSGKTVVPFATSGGSGISGSEAALRKTYPDLDWKEGKRLNRVSPSDLRPWLESLGLETGK